MAEVPAIVARELSVTLGDRQVLHQVALTARFGELLAILGPNGAGKSTLLRALAGLQPHQGSVELADLPDARASARERARHLSFVPQHSQLAAPLPVREVVALGRYPQAHTPRSARAATDAAAIEQAMRDTDVLALAERAFSDLSSGEQKRVLLARALCTGARTLLLDEPTAALDVEHALALFARLRSAAAQGRAIVLVLHQIEHALAYADAALLLGAGRVRASGPAREVITASEVRALYRVEMIANAAPGFRLPGEPT